MSRFEQSILDRLPSNSETLLNSVNSKIMFLNFFKALCSVVLWSKYHFFQTMHRQKIIFFTFCWNAFVAHFLVLLRLSVYRYFDQKYKFFNSSIDRKPYFQFFLSSNFFDHWQKISTISDARFFKQNSTFWSNLIKSSFSYALYVTSWQLFWRFFGILLTLKYPKMWRNSVTTKSEKGDLLSMHELEKLGFWSKYHWTESLKKVPKHDFPFYTVEKRFKIWSRAAYDLLLQ